MMSEGDFPDEPGESVPKIRVFWSSGNGTALWDQRIGPEDRSWLAPPAADYAESLYASDSGMLLRCFHSKHPQLSGLAECGDLFDADSYAVNCIPAEAVEWLCRYGYAIPDDLRRAAESGCNLATLPHLWTAKLRRMIFPGFDADDRCDVLKQIGRVLENAVSSGAFSAPALASAAQVANADWPANEWENIAKSFIAALQQVGRVVDERSNTALIETLADGLDLIADEKPPCKSLLPAESPKEQRDKWIYGECMKGTVYQTIAIRLKKKPKKWPRIESNNGIKMAAARYAERHSLDAPPARQSGRRAR